MRDDLWAAACAMKPELPNEKGMLCVGCLEQRLGRELSCRYASECRMIGINS